MTQRYSALLGCCWKGHAYQEIVKRNVDLSDNECRYVEIVVCQIIKLVVESSSSSDDYK